MRAPTLALLRIVFWGALFLAIFAVLTAGIAFAAACFRDSEIDDPANLTVGIVSALAVWLFLAMYYLRQDVVQVPFANRDSILQQIRTVAGELGYVVVADSREHIRFHPSFAALLMGGGVVVRVNDHSAMLVGPRVSLRLLRRRLRLHQQLACSLPHPDSRRRHHDPLLKRVQVSLRLPPDRWPEVLDHLIAVLGQDANLTCDLHILAQSAGGVRDSIIEERVRNWLHERDIAVEIHKDHVQIIEVSAAPAEHRLPV